MLTLLVPAADAPEQPLVTLQLSLLSSLSDAYFLFCHRIKIYFGTLTCHLMSFYVNVSLNPFKTQINKSSAQ